IVLAYVDGTTRCDLVTIKILIWSSKTEIDLPWSFPSNLGKLGLVRVHEANMGTINPLEGLHYRHYYDFDEVAYTFQVEAKIYQRTPAGYVAISKKHLMFSVHTCNYFGISVLKKDKAHAEKTQTQAVMCVARLATTFASITAVESKRLDELVESGSDHHIVVFVVQSAISIHNPRDLMTLTTGRNIRGCWWLFTTAAVVVMVRGSDEYGDEEKVVVSLWRRWWSRCGGGDDGRMMLTWWQCGDDDGASVVDSGGGEGGGGCDSGGCRKTSPERWEAPEMDYRCGR
nr:hypothetical protein [Tanacetum cinerariifolium]